MIFLLVKILVVVLGRKYRGIDRLKGGWARPPEMGGVRKDARMGHIYFEHPADYMEEKLSMSRIIFKVAFMWSFGLSFCILES
jgi:hypothetical protein